MVVEMVIVDVEVEPEEIMVVEEVVVAVVAVEAVEAEVVAEGKH